MSTRDHTDILPGPHGATLVAYCGGNADPDGYWPNDDADAFAVSLGQSALADNLVDDDQDGQPVEADRSLVAYLDELTIDVVDA